MYVCVSLIIHSFIYLFIFIQCFCNLFVLVFYVPLVFFIFYF